MTSQHVLFIDQPLDCLVTESQDGDLFSGRQRQMCAKACRLVTEIQRLHRNQRTALVGKRCLVSQVMRMKLTVDGWTNCPCFASLHRQSDLESHLAELDDLHDLRNDISQRVARIDESYQDVASACTEESSLGSRAKYAW